MTLLRLLAFVLFVGAPVDCFADIFASVESGDRAALTAALAARADPNQVKDGNTLLHIALMRAAGATNDLEVIRVLLEHGSDVDAYNSHGYAPFHLMVTSFAPVRRFSVARLQLLLTFGADIDAQERRAEKFAPLHYAVFGGDKETVRDLLRFGASVDRADAEGRSALHLAAQTSGEIAALLLAHGADVHLTTHHGFTPLHTATAGLIEGKRFDARPLAAIKVLLANGAVTDINRETPGGHTPLLYAIGAQLISTPEGEWDQPSLALDLIVRAAVKRKDVAEATFGRLLAYFRSAPQVTFLRHPIIELAHALGTPVPADVMPE